MAGVEIWSSRPDANIVGSSGRLHKQHLVTLGNGNVLHPCLPLVCIRGMFLQNCFTFSMVGGFYWLNTW
jgi:hypothetical protein